MTRPARVKKAPTAKYTVEQRIAIGENANLMMLLTETKIPHAKDLAMVVLARIKSIADGALVMVASDEDADMMTELARQNIDEEDQ